jgi:hypothetical protein
MAEVDTVVAEDMAAVADMAEAFMEVAASTGVAFTAAAMPADFTVGDFMAEGFTATLMPFMPLRGLDAVVRVTSRATLRPGRPARAMRMFLKAPSLAVTPPQAV